MKDVSLINKICASLKKLSEFTNSTKLYLCSTQTIRFPPSCLSAGSKPIKKY